MVLVFEQKFSLPDAITFHAVGASMERVCV
jgi:hypothetical protein